jgi:hypothetical protein
MAENMSVSMERNCTLTCTGKPCKSLLQNCRKSYLADPPLGIRVSVLHPPSSFRFLHLPPHLGGSCTFSTFRACLDFFVRTWTFLCTPGLFCVRTFVRTWTFVCVHNVKCAQCEGAHKSKVRKSEGVHNVKCAQCEGVHNVKCAQVKCAQVKVRTFTWCTHKSKVCPK